MIERGPDFIGAGWAFPLRVNGRGGIELSRGAQDVEEAMRLILATPLGERRMRPDFGCGVSDLTFATNDPTTHGQVEHDVREALELWEPRIQVVDVRADLEPDADAQVRVEVEYVLRATNELRNLVYPFYLIPGEE
jgi:uncharacterized protein